MLTIQFVPYGEMEPLQPEQRIKKVLDVAKQDKIVLLEGRLAKEEEANLISMTMSEINNKFKGIELAVINPETLGAGFVGKLKGTMATLLLGNRVGFTIIGPASIVKEIKKNPNKIEMYINDRKKRK
ncbi:MAG TPA: DUF2073 domain-containing protein [Candidatus Nanoarchaeia archaeon]|nr:DUF2073 domain-containing protein [Candidatus Nanoarchaeia archaeon]